MQRVMIHPLRSSVLLKAERKPYDECKIAVAGPLVSGALAFLLWGYLALSGAPLLQTVRMKLIPGGDVCSDLLLMNGLLFAGSLIPALPLEGGRMIRSVLSRYWGRQRATMVVAQCSLFVAFALMLLAAFTATALWALLSLVIAIGSTREAQMALYRNQIQGKVVRAAMQPTLRSLKPGDSIGLAEKYLSFDGQQSFPVVLGTDVVGVLAGNRIRDGISRLGRNAYISEIMDRGVVCVGPDQSLEMVLVVVQNIERTPIIVMEEGKVVGMLTHSSVSEFFARSS
jgi:stage IV sporulation protein FB